MKNNELAIKEKNNLPSIDVKSLMNEFQDSVNVRESLVKIPQLKLDQALSESVKGKISQPGEFSCFTRGIAFGPEVNIIPLMISESASLLSAPPVTEIVCSSRNLVTNQDGIPCMKCPHNAYWNDWGTKENPKLPACKSSIDVIVIVDPFKTHQIMQLSFRKSNYKAGKTLVNLIKGDPRKIPFGRIYTLFSKEATSKSQEYFIINSKKIAMRNLNDNEIEEIIPSARALLKSKRENQVVIEVGHDDFAEDSADDIPM